MSGAVRALYLAGLLAVMGVGCSAVPTEVQDGRLRVLATTSIVGDVVREVGGEHISLTILLPVGTDPHEYSPRPQDMVALEEAEIIFANGAGLEGFLEPMLESADLTGMLVEVSSGIDVLALEGEGGVDPHTWMDPTQVQIWVENIAATLTESDPEHAGDYAENARLYSQELAELDAWARAELEGVAMGNRVLVSDHDVLRYFARRYGFEVAGSMTGSFSSEAAPSSRELAELEDEIVRLGVGAIFVTESGNLPLAEQVAEDTGVRVVTLFHASLTEAGELAESYLELMRYNVRAISEALK